MLNNNLLRRLIKEKIILGTEHELTNGIFYPLDSDWFNKQVKRTFEHVGKIAERYNIETILIGYKDREPNNITVIEHNISSLIEFDINEHDPDYTLFDSGNAVLGSFRYINDILLSEENNMSKFELIQSKLNETKELIELSKQIKSFERIILWNESLYKVVEVESLKQSFDGYTLEIGFLIESESE